MIGQEGEGMKRTSVWLLVIAIMAIAAIAGLAACGSEEQDSGAVTPVPATFTYSSPYEVMPGGWDPATDYSSENIAMANMYEGLTRYNSENETVEPLLAESWEVNDDGTVWTFKLRQGVMFHTGRPLTAAAVKEALDRTIELGQGAAYEWAAVESIEAVDDLTVVFQLKDPAPLDLVTSSSYQAWIYDIEAAGEGDLADWFAEGNEAGTGPYVADEWKKGQEIELTLSAYKDYWGGWDGRHYDRVVFRFVPEPTTAAQLMSAGEVDFVPFVTPEIWESFANDEAVATPTASSFENIFAVLNTKKAPLDDVRVRQALALAIDYDGLLTVLKGSAQAQSGIVPPGLLGHVDGMGNDTHDPDQAAALLQQAGYGPNGEPIKLLVTHISGDNVAESAVTVMKASFADLNIEIDARPMQWTALWDKARSTNEDSRQDIAMFHWYPDYPDATSWFSSMFTTQDPPEYNLSYYSNETIDRLSGELPALIATDQAAAEDAFAEMQDILIEDMPSIPLVNFVYQRLLTKSVEGYVDNPTYANVVFVYDLTPAD
jgi:peptide/nickel transport system substrate-binding protein